MMQTRFRNILCGWFCAAFGGFVVTADAGPPRLSDQGVEIDGGNMGAFTLAYPKIATKTAPSKHETASEQRLVDGKSVLKYPCGTAIEVSIGQDGKVAYRFSGNRYVVEHFRVGELLVPPKVMSLDDWT